jgi:hypothetical protein
MHPLWEKEKCWLSGGGGMLVHRQAAVRMVPHIEDCWLVDQGHNDVTIGCTSIGAGVPLVHSELVSPENKNPNFVNNPIHLQTMITEHHISPQLQVAMFADLP